ncbi:hypothetical protein G4G28_21510 [Massilia sp. Dwa41.01b]|uniref:PP0621 family protein n=1 Tax=unclassified Massilia TaxID=2609279 RepID=UPI001602E00C|nr:MULTISPECIES: PP0621 family protein [unclassified Massilia]QNA90425.1 hypothetical protein G4G28_21510 [Massilia sp. Dwa41.01b]QNA97654.1 hypothetical protein G4G31_00590 [Massilia sp. Se16.2.3]
MSRLVFWIGLAILIVFALRSKLRAAARRADDAAPRRPPAPAPRAAIEDMTRCAHCGLHFPASEAVRADGLDYCSPSHVRLPPH